MNKNLIDISSWTIIKILLIILAIIFLWFIRDIILLLLITWVLVTILHPTIDRLHKNGIPRILGVILIYALLLAILAAIISLIAPSLIWQINQLINNWPEYVNNFSPFYESLKNFATNLGLSIETTQSVITPLTGSVYGITLNFLGGIVSSLIVLIITFYVLIEEEAIKSFWVSLFPTDKKNQVIEILDKITKSWGAWIRSRIILSLIVGILIYIALLILNVPFALTLAVLMALLDFIPYIGPILATIPALIIAFAANGWLSALLVIIIIMTIQQIESYIFAPKIMQKTIGISPITVIVSVLIGAKLFGIAGVILAIPVAAVLVIIFQEWQKFKKTNK